MWVSLVFQKFNSKPIESWNFDNGIRWHSVDQSYYKPSCGDHECLYLMAQESIHWSLSYFNLFWKLTGCSYVVAMSDCLCSSICSVQPVAASVKNRLGTHSMFSRAGSRFWATSETCCEEHLVGSQELIRMAAGYVAAGTQPNTTQKIIGCSELSSPL